MDEKAEPAARRDFPACGDGYDRAAVDAHLDRLAARLGGGADLSARGPAGDGGLLSAGRLLLDEIGALRRAIDQLATSLGEQSTAIAGALDELIGLAADTAEPGSHEAAEPGPSEAAEPPGTIDAAGAADPTEDEPHAGATHAAVEATIADARLIALDMALGGSSRAEIEQELAARFDLPDPVGLTDEVFASIG